jgi:hypothetical protein
LESSNLRGGGQPPPRFSVRSGLHSGFSRANAPPG